MPEMKKVVLPLFVFFVAVAISASAQSPQRKPAGSTLRIVSDELIQVNHGDCDGCFYAVKGSIYNPNDAGVKNVIIRYYIWKKWMGKDGHGYDIKEKGGLVEAKLKFLPPRQTIEFLANDGLAPVMTPESKKLPDPISAEIEAEWDEQ